MFAAACRRVQISMDEDDGGVSERLVKARPRAPKSKVTTSTMENSSTSLEALGSEDTNFSAGRLTVLIALIIKGVPSAVGSRAVRGLGKGYKRQALPAQSAEAGARTLDLPVTADLLLGGGLPGWTFGIPPPYRDQSSTNAGIWPSASKTGWEYGMRGFSNGSSVH